MSDSMATWCISKVLFVVSDLSLKKVQKVSDGIHGFINVHIIDLTISSEISSIVHNT